MWGAYYNLPKAIFYLLKGDYIYIHMSTSLVIGEGLEVFLEPSASLVSPWPTVSRNWEFLKLRGLGCTWTPKVCKMMAFIAIIRGLGLLFYILLGV